MKIYKLTVISNNVKKQIVVTHYDLFKIVDIVMNKYNITISDIVNISIKNIRTK